MFAWSASYRWNFVEDSIQESENPLRKMYHLEILHST